jgi:hypothetical protein
MKFWLGLIIFIASQLALAYPDLARHGYASCLACHVSPSGGGLTTPYGRSLSKELLSHWGHEGEEKVFGAYNPPEWLNIGGDFRAVQTYVDTPVYRQSRFFEMQSDLEVAVSKGPFYLDTTMGVQEGPDTAPNRGHFLSRRHYLGYRPNDQISLRAGRFMANYGLNIADHTASIRRQLGFDEGQETDNVEAAYFTEKTDFFLTGLFSRMDEPWDDHEHGLALSTSYFFLDRYKIGLSYMHSTKHANLRDTGGAWGILGFGKKIYALSEIDFQWSRSIDSGGASKHGGVSYQQLNYEFLQGFHVYLAHQLVYLDFNDTLSRMDSVGLGSQIYPRPHLDFQLEYRKERTMAISTNYNDVAWLMLHYYL